MKNLLLTLFTVLALNVFSQTATVTVFSQDGEKFWVILNGIKQNETPTTNVKVTGLSSPNYRLKIIFDDEKIVAIDKDIMTKNYDNVLCDQAYVIKKDKKGKHVMRLNSFEPAKTIAATVEPNQVAVPFTAVESKPAESKPVESKPVQQTKPTQVQPSVNVSNTNSKDNSNVAVQVKDPATGENINMNMNVSPTGVGVSVKDPSGQNVNMNVNMDMGDVQSTRPTQPTQSTQQVQSTRPTQPVPVQPTQPAYKLPGYNGPQGCELPMSTQDFNDAKKSISSKSLDDSKLAIAKQVTSANCLLTTQVKDIMILFSFEETKLQYAKYAYQYTFDLGNFYKVNDAFKFEMSINELDEFISSKKK